MARTVAEIQADLTTVNAAIQAIIQGERLTQLRLGSGEFARAYSFQEITLEALQAERATLLQELQIAEPSATNEVRFRAQSTIPLSVNKFPGTYY